DWKKGINTGNQLYDHMLGQYNHATALLDSGNIQHKVVGFFWMQGESDAAAIEYATAYETNLKNLIQNIRADVGNSALNVILGRIGTHLPPSYSYKETVRRAQMKIADDDPLVNWVDTDDLPLDTDSIHLLADGVKTAGQRMAAAWLNQVATSITESGEGARYDFLLHNFPNPFNPATTIRFTLSKPEHVTVKIYDLLGRELEILTQTNYSAGVHSVVFNANQYATGIYLYEVQIGNERIHKMMSLIK
ncbi:MAG: T9SS type A sorting domain-containing protein, partial [Rhodothermaceae bacterium]|nr:T9SS type A sorting domain-containing protein [Rhodothermaceae bacterium]